MARLAFPEVVAYSRNMNFVSRSQWGARPARSTTPIAHPTRGIANHYEGPRMGSFDHSTCAGRVKGIQNFHMDSRGWADIAYSALVCPHGWVYEGRGPNYRTAANGTNDGNAGYLAVCYLSGEGDPLTDAAKQGFIDCHAWLERNGAGRSNVGHRDLFSTACPGEAVYAWTRAGMPAPDGSGAVVNPAPAPTVDDSWRPENSDNVYEKGEVGPHVQQIQEALKIPSDGYYGDVTVAAVRTFQQQRGLDVDGLVGPQTWAALFPAPAPAPAPSTVTGTGYIKSWLVTLSEGSNGSVVGHLQRLLGIRDDGIFGPATRGAVVARQRSLGLSQDGVVGPDTWSRIHPTVGQGDTGWMVGVVQREVGVVVDEDFGPATDAAVRNYQRTKGVIVDGIFGAGSLRAAFR